jgi:hypothetical protein
LIYCAVYHEIWAEIKDEMIGHASVTKTAVYDRRGDAAKRKAADLMHVPFFRGRPERTVKEPIAASAFWYR